jgi:diguanylate cyclase (GGDEF)-like protein
LTILLADVDYFKSYNDYYGHLAGDDCLREIAAALNQQLRRPYDLVARYGGEEFVALFPETDAAGADVLAEKMRAAVADLALIHTVSTAAPHITISVGGVSVIPADFDQPAREVIALADSRLYQAKLLGRNCCCLGPWQQGEKNNRLSLASKTDAAVVTAGGDPMVSADFVRGKRDALKQVLRSRFGRLEEAIETRITQAPLVWLDAWLDKAAGMASSDVLLAGPPPAE